MGKHMVPEGVFQNWLDEQYRNDEEVNRIWAEAEYNLIQAKTDYYKNLADLAKEQILTEKLKRKAIEKTIDKIDINVALKNGPLTFKA